MVHVEHDAIDQHQGAVKDVEKGFVICHVATIALKNLDDAIDIADQDNRAADI